MSISKGGLVLSGPALQVELLLATRRWNSYISTVRGRRPTLNTDLSDNILASAKPHTYAFCPALNSGAIKSYFSLQQKLITQNSSLLILRIPQLLTLLILNLVSDAGATTTHDQHLSGVLISKYRDLQPRFKINISFVIIKNH